MVKCIHNIIFKVNYVTGKNRKNQLSCKKSQNGRSDGGEKAEQAQLRGEYIAEWREGVIQTLENTYVVDENGKRKLRKKQ